MKNICIETKVKGHYLEVMKRFDRDLFVALKPSFPKMDILEFTGSETGDKVHIKFHSPLSFEWISNITDHGLDDNEAYFTDEGTLLPPGLKYWKHKHIVRKIDEATSLIIDDITFNGKNALVTALLWPVVYTGFLPRKKIYRQYFI